jgi:hypothetical protein
MLTAAWAVSASMAQTATTNHTDGVRGKSISKPYSNAADSRNTVRVANAISFVLIGVLRLWKDKERKA